MFNLSHRVLTETEIKVLEKGLDYAPIQMKTNAPELRKDFSEFCRRMRNKWYFRNEPTLQFSEVPCCKTMSSWRPPNGHPALEMFLNKVEKDLFDICKKQQTYLHFNSEGLGTMRYLADDRNLGIKKADKGSCVVFWDRNDYLMEAEKQLSDKNVYKEVKFNEKLIQDLTKTSNKIFRNLRNGGFITDKELKYFSFNHKRASNLGKLYLLPKIHRGLFNVPGRPVISNCRTPTEKASEFLDSHLKTIMQESWSYIKDSTDFINKIGQIGDIPESAILETVDIVGLYPSIPHMAGLKALKNALDKRKQKHILTEKLINVAEFVLKNNFFEFNGLVKQQVSGRAIGVKCAPTYACIYMDEVETEFLKTQERTPLVWFRYNDDIFFISTHGREHLETFLQELNNFNPDLKFTYESNEKEISFLDLKAKLNEGKISTDLYIKSMDRHRYLHFTSSHPSHTKRSIVNSQGLQVKRICFEKEDFLKHMRKMKLWFLKRGYPENIVDQELGKVESSESSRRTNEKYKNV